MGSEAVAQANFTAPQASPEALIIRRVFILVEFLVIASAQTARAQSNGDLTQNEMIALNNFHHEMVECVAYYAIANEGLKQRDNQETAAAYQGTSDVLLEFMSVIGQRIGIKSEATTARIRMGFKRQRDKIDRDFFNI